MTQDIHMQICPEDAAAHDRPGVSSAWRNLPISRDSPGETAILRNLGWRYVHFWVPFPETSVAMMKRFLF
jgi:hypothetical protein